MKTKSTFLLLVMFLILHPMLAQEYSKGRLDSSRIQIINSDATIKVGDTLSIKVAYYNVDSLTKTQAISFAVSPDSLGTFNGKYFIAMKPGEGSIRASVGTLSDKMEINVRDSVTFKDDDDHDAERDDDNDKDSISVSKLRILPNDTIVAIGSIVNYKAQILNDSNVWVDINAKWALMGKRIGSITSNGQVEITGHGVGYIVAITDSGRFVTRLMSQETVADTLDLNKITISRVLSDGKVISEKTVLEGGKYKIGGLPAPYNLLNGAQIYFPVGCLHEDIALHIKLPTFAKVDSAKSISFGKKVLNAVSFEVYVNDVHISPYYFDTPLNITIPFKRGLMKNMGMNVTKLSLFYADDSLDLTPKGISNLMIDSMSNVISSNVEHFSTLAIAEENQVLTVKNASTLSLIDFYPNPIEDILNINLNEIETEGISIIITNIFGQTVLSRNSVSSEMQLDISKLGSGIYNLQILDNQHKLLASKKLIKR